MTGSGRVLLVGATGWLGSAIARRLDGVVAVPSRELLAGGWADLQRRLADGDVLVNAAGSKNPDEMERVNTELVARLADAAADRGASLVQLGSAAEYGIPDGARPLREADPAHPSSPYGRSKLAATELVRQIPLGCSLGVFNIAAHPPQPGSPLEVALGRVAAGVAANRAPEVMSAGPTRARHHTQHPRYERDDRCHGNKLILMMGYSAQTHEHQLQAIETLSRMSPRFPPTAHIAGTGLDRRLLGK